MIFRTNLQVEPPNLVSDLLYCKRVGEPEELTKKIVVLGSLGDGELIRLSLGGFYD